MPLSFDVIVVGGGHAGIEAALSSARMNCSVALITMDQKTIGRLSCNPSIGGSAKGHLAREIDSLGGEMGVLADKSGLQFKMLNTSKGPAVWSPRSQNDKDLYPQFAQNILRSTPNITILSFTVEEIVIENSTIKGVKSKDGSLISCKALVLCGGTFLNAVMHTGLNETKGGRIGEKPAEKISDLLADYGLKKGRLKTGTPPRITCQSVDYSKLSIEHGDNNPAPFSHKTTIVKNTIVCYGTQTSEATHTILRQGFERSPMFTGRIQGAGPRYCPSIEDKISRFSERSSHQIVLEPEGLHSDTLYVNGFSTSLPQDIQQKGLQSIYGLENAEISKFGYAVEYDFFYPYQLKFTLETKNIDGLYFAGQINGTSGYEEAAAQGLIAGINAARKIHEQDEFTLLRSEAYIGVLIDDLVNKSTEEPYRIFTSLAEYRLLLRQDNAEDRLMKYGHSFGLISSKYFNREQQKGRKQIAIREFCDTQKISPDLANPYLQSVGETALHETTTITTLARRYPTSLTSLLELIPNKTDMISYFGLDNKAMTQAEIDIKYEGYIKRQVEQISYFKENEEKKIPHTFNYNNVQSLSKEARQKLSLIRPQSLGQASRISGVSASDISVLAIYLR